MMTIDARLELFKKQFPKEKITSVQERRGDDHSVVEINHTWMCKSALREQDIPALEKEVQLLTMLENKITTQVPVPVHYEHNFFVYKKIMGSPLIAYTYYRMGKKQQAKLAFQVAEFLLELHAALSAEQIASLQLAQSDWPWSVEKLQEYRHYMDDNQDVVEIFDKVMKVHAEEMQASFVPTLIHNDMDLKNIIIDPLTGVLRGIIDFADMAYDDPALDLRMRSSNPLPFSTAVAMVYSLLTKKEQRLEKLHSYYFATEFSRYLDALAQGDQEQAQQCLGVIVESIREIMNQDDACDDGPCAHDHTAQAKESHASL